MKVKHTVSKCFKKMCIITTLINVIFAIVIFAIVIFAIVIYPMVKDYAQQNTLMLVS